MYVCVEALPYYKYKQLQSLNILGLRLKDLCIKYTIKLVK